MSSPTDPPFDDQQLTNYVLGMLPEAEEEQLDELSIADDDFAARLDGVRHDLIDAYVRGQLRGDRLERFEVCFLSSPAMRSRIRFAEALLAHQPDKGTLGAMILAQRWRPTAAQWGLATAAALLLAISGYLMLDNARLRRLVGESASVQGSLQNRERELQRELDAQRAAAADAAKELARTRETVAQLQARAESPSAARPVALSFLLMPARRGPGDVTTIAIPVRTDAVTLRFEPEDVDSVRFRVAIRNAAEDRVLWRSPDLNVTTDGTGTTTVTATLAAALLTPGTYVAELSGQPRGHTSAESVGSYTFRVTRP